MNEKEEEELYIKTFHFFYLYRLEDGENVNIVWELYIIIAIWLAEL